MIRDVTKAQVDLLKTTQKQEKAEPREGGTRDVDGESQEVRGDRVTLNATEEKAVTYSKPLTAGQQIAAKFSALQEMVSTLFADQGAAGALVAGGDTINDQLSQLFKKLGMSTTIDIGGGATANLQDLTQADAQKLIAEDGYWGIEQTSDRIASFAFNAAGNDPAKLGRVKEAVMKGYEMAKEAFGGYLPDISQKTIDAVMTKLDSLTQQGDPKPSV